MPALHAKKWILVGDVKQLSPYTEVDHLVASLEEHSDKDGATLFGETSQQACLLIWKYICSFKHDSKYCIVERDAVINTIKMEIKARYIANSKGINSEVLEKVVFLDKNNTNNTLRGILNIVTLEDCVNGNPVSWVLPSV